jgi:hypothetical protein
MPIVNPRELNYTTASQYVRIDQTRETPFTQVPTPCAEIGYLYARASDSRSNQIEGQDYLAFNYNQGVISFAVCDGVGQSFCGNLAAQFLGDALVKWFEELGPVAREDVLASKTTRFLEGLTARGQQRVVEYPLPLNLPPLIKAALEGQRAYGSETMFVGGCLRFPQDPCDLSDAGQLWLCWLGDTQVQLFDRAGQPIDLEAEWATQERWSMTKGVRGAEGVHARMDDLSQIGRVIVHSDGLSSVANHLYDLLNTPQLLQQEAERIYNSPESDDISLIDIRLRVLPAPELYVIKNPWRLGSYLLHWSPVPNAADYMIEEAGDAGFGDATTWLTADTSYRVEERSPADYFYRVRAIYDGTRGEPSNVQHVRPLAIWGSLELVLLVFIVPILLLLAILAFWPK